MIAACPALEVISVYGVGYDAVDLAACRSRGIVGKDFIDAVGPDGMIINISRAANIDEEALIAALSSGALGAAALDVFEGEPAFDPRFLELDNVLLQPHHALDTIETRKAMGKLVRDNLTAHFAAPPADPCLKRSVMKSIVAHAAKDLRIEDHPMPVPGNGQVLVKMAAGGICGSDLHYYNHGGFGTIRLKEPMTLGHEVAGHIEALGAGVTGFASDDLVAVSPSRPCGTCVYCQEGSQNHCLNMRFYGSAMPFPHIQGAFSEYVVAEVAQCALANGLTAGEAAMAEPLSVVLHAAQQAGDLFGKRVLVTGCGPIGLLAVLVARQAGALEIVATDVADFTLSKARAVGADKTINVAQEAEGLDMFTADKGHFDVLFECSGVASALAAAVPALRPKATIMQLGLGGDMTLPMQAMTAKELRLKGSFRFHAEFFKAVAMMQNGRLDVKPLITHAIPVAQAVEAFEMASDRSQAIKVNIVF